MSPAQTGADHRGMVAQRGDTEKEAPDPRPRKAAGSRALALVAPPPLSTSTSTRCLAPTVPAPARTFHLTDSGNAEAFAARQGRNVRFDHRRQRWLIWRGNRWQPDTDAAIYRLAKSATRQRLRGAAEIDDPDKRDKEVRHALASESRSRIDAMLGLARAEHPIADAGERWDVDPTVLCVANGVVDLRNGQLRPGRRDDRITLMAGVEYRPDARSDLWEHALRTILVDDELIQFFHLAAGYSATGDTSRDCWFLCCGDGRNGKGTLLQPIRRALGGYALELPGAMFDVRAARAPYELADLPGRRFVTSSESGDTICLNHDRIKQLTGGDPMSAANKYERAFEFDPSCKLWLACNKKPSATDDTPAFWARVLLIPFTVSFVGREDRSLRPALVQDPAHQAAVLAWIVRGAVRYYAEGLSVLPARVRMATAAYREDSNPLAAFFAEACELRSDTEVGANALYEHYARWADAQHYSQQERLSASLFGRLMGAKFEGKKHPRTGVKHYRGIAPKASV